MRRIDFIIEPSHDGSTVEQYLLGEKGFSRRLITKLKYASDGILLNGEHTRTVDFVRTGDVLSVKMEDEKFLEENSALDIPTVYDDDDIVVFDKPCGVPVHPSIRHRGDTLGNFFAARYVGLSFRPINRLDRDTSGLCVVAKNAYAAARLQQSVDKTYYAVVSEKIEGSGRICAPIARESDTIIKRKVDENGQEAITDYEPIEYANGFTLLKIHLLTGRTHQIRVHFAYIGYPLAGDSLYGGDCGKISRQALHCGETEFSHPVSNKKISLSVPLPTDIRNLLL